MTMFTTRILSNLLSISYSKSSVCLRASSIKYTLSIAFCSTVSISKPLRSKKPKSTSPMIHFFVDKYRVRAIGGKGGDGMISYLSEWAKEFAGPDGGDGGNGGHVLFQSSNNVNSLNHCSSVAEGKHGENGKRKHCHGKNAEHSIIQVPIGTIVKNDEGRVIGDLDKEDMLFIAARGGAGGRGNAFFATDIQQTPDIAEYGAVGEEKHYTLEVRSMAHVGLLGFPNAGKSTLLRAMTRAKPKVAPYPFTTLHPHIGMVLYEDYEQIAIADLPGLIPGSHKNRGLGIQFLQHVERCLCLIFVVDVSADKPWKQITTLQHELSEFNPELLTRPKLIVANKIDLPETMNNVEGLKKHCKDYEIFPVSAKMGTNIYELLLKLKVIYEEFSEKTTSNKIIS